MHEKNHGNRPTLKKIEGKKGEGRDPRQNRDTFQSTPDEVLYFQNIEHRIRSLQSVYPEVDADIFRDFLTSYDGSLIQWERESRGGVSSVLIRTLEELESTPLDDTMPEEISNDELCSNMAFLDQISSVRARAALLASQRDPHEVWQDLEKLWYEGLWMTFDMYDVPVPRTLKEKLPMDLRTELEHYFQRKKFFQRDKAQSKTPTDELMLRYHKQKEAEGRQQQPTNVDNRLRNRKQVLDEDRNVATEIGLPSDYRSYNSGELTDAQQRGLLEKMFELSDRFLDLIYHAKNEKFQF